MEVDRCKIDEALMYLWEDKVQRTFASLYSMDKITKEIEVDYLEFCEVAREIFEEMGEKFSVLKVYEKLPNNKWGKMYRENCFKKKSLSLPLNPYTQ